MTRTDVMASSRPRTAGAASMRKGSSRILRRLSILPLLALLALALIPGAALAAEPTSGYGTTSTSTTPTSGYSTTTPAPTTTPTTTTPSKGVAPSKEAEKPTSTTPASETAPAKTSTTPTSEKAGTLPFTGFDLRWDIGFGLLLMLAGFSIVLVQRRQRRDSGR
jgi:cytoskeletal protein RodZ